ncbi:hypothetical protein VSK92_02715 [Bacillus swezeyi]|uniref:hypothetical protein n=1 Tax=Bacillus swezeyi TaxID=1925020 RepID=UPI0039C7332E
MNIPKPECNHRHAWEEYENKIDEIKWLHFDKLMTVGRISEKLGIPDWIILNLLEAKKVDKLSHPDYVGDEGRVISRTYMITF